MAAERRAGNARNRAREGCVEGDWSRKNTGITEEKALWTRAASPGERTQKSNAGSQEITEKRTLGLENQGSEAIARQTSVRGRAPATAAPRATRKVQPKARRCGLFPGIEPPQRPTVDGSFPSNPGRPSRASRDGSEEMHPACQTGKISSDRRKEPEISDLFRFPGVSTAFGTDHQPGGAAKPPENDRVEHLRLGMPLRRPGARGPRA